MLAQADTVVLFDAVQSTKNDWRNRNQIKTPSGKRWLTIPVKHSTTIRVREVAVARSDWHEKHYRSLSQVYARAPHAAQVLPQLHEWYSEAGELSRLSAINRVFLRGVCEFLEIKARFLEVESILDDEQHDRLDPTSRLVEICERLGATSYLSGPAARGYLDTSAFERLSIAVEWFDYVGYPTYPQLHGEFDHSVSIVDLLLMTGPDARHYAIRHGPTAHELPSQDCAATR